MKYAFACSYLDYVSVMTYDYYGAWDNVTGINAPLYGKDLFDEEEDEQWKNVVSYDADETEWNRILDTLEQFNTLLVIQRLSSGET